MNHKKHKKEIKIRKIELKSLPLQ